MVRHFICILYIFKYIGVGKAEILKKAREHIFENNNTTIGIDYVLLNIKINNKVISLQIWDTCGQERFYSIIKGFYRNISLIFLVYSIDK